jgi:uncharacterized protein DUF3558
MSKQSERGHTVKRLAVLVGMVGLGMGLAACSTGTPGQGVPTSTPSTSDAPGGLGSLNACSLLSASEATSVGLPSTGTVSNAGSHSGCEWDGSQFTVGVDVRLDVGLSGIVATGGAITDTTIGRHTARQTDSQAGCLIAMGITNSSRVDALATGNTQAGQCAEARAVAAFVEKRLPSS